MPSYRGEFGAIHPKYAADSPARCEEWKESSAAIVDLVYSAEDDAAIEQWVRENTGTTWHSMATCPMKPEADGGVVDARLNVYGTKSLKLAGSFHFLLFPLLRSRTDARVARSLDLPVEPRYQHLLGRAHRRREGRSAHR